MDSVRQNGNARAWWLLALSAIGVFVPVSFISFLAALCLVLWLPGHGIIRLLPAVWKARGRVASALAAALLLVPLPLTCLWLFTNNRFVLAGSLVALNAIVLLLHRGSSNLFYTVTNNSDRSLTVAVRIGWRVAFWLLILYVGLLTLCFHWLPGIGGRLAASPSYDFVKHHAVLVSLDRYELPLHSIYYAAEKDTPYYYYHYQYLVPATLRILTGRLVSIHLAFGVFAGLVAALLISMVCLISLKVWESPSAALLSGCLVSIVGGFDIIPVLLQNLSGKPMFVVLDSWVSFPWRIHNIADNFIWCPQHVAALMVFVACCYWLQIAPRARWWLVIAPLAAASIFGSSVYQAMTVFAAAGAYVAIEILRWRREWAGGRVGEWANIWSTFPIIIVGLGTAAALIIPQAIGYSDMNQRYPGGITAQWERFEYAFFGRLVEPGVLANFLDAWWLIAIDLGLPLLAFFFVQQPLRLLWRTSGTRLLLICGIIGVASTFVLRSNVTKYDYCFRSTVMVLNCAAAVLAGGLLIPNRIRLALRSARLPVLAIGIVLGLPVGLYELPVMAVRTLFERKFQPGTDADAVRFVRDGLSDTAVVQGDPVGRLTLPQITHRQMGVLDPTNPHVVVFRPLDSAKMHKAMTEVENAFASSTSRDAYTILRSWGITHVLLGNAERLRWGEMPHLREPSYFREVFKDDHAAVYQLNSDK